MTLGTQTAIGGTLLLLALARLGLAQSPDTATMRRVVTDSLRAETCRGGTLSASGLTCRGATAAPRVTYLRRFANRADSLTRAWQRDAGHPQGAVAAVRIGWQDYAEAHYNSPQRFWPSPGVDTVTVCATIHYPGEGRTVLGRPAIRLTFLEGKDSVRVAFRGGNPMAEMCAHAIAAVGGTVADTVPVTWRLVALQVASDHPARRAWRPVPGVGR